MKKTKILFPIFLGILLISSFFFLVSFCGATIGVVDYVSYDVKIYSDTPDTNYEGLNLALGTVEGRYLYALMDFNITYAVEQYGLGVVPEYVYIRLWAKFQQMSPDENLTGVLVYPITESWNSSEVTWNTKPSYSSVSTTEQELDLNHGNNQYFYFDITSDFLDVLARAGTSFYGYMLVCDSNGQSLFWADMAGEPDSDESSIYYSDEDLLFIDDDIDDGGFMNTKEGANLMLIFIFLFVPSMFLAMIMKSVGIPVIGFIAGLGIMTSIGVKVGLIDLWFLFVMVLVMVLLILSMVKRGIYT